jgi:hypothetical protein
MKRKSTFSNGRQARGSANYQTTKLRSKYARPNPTLRTKNSISGITVPWNVEFAYEFLKYVSSKFGNEDLSDYYLLWECPITSDANWRISRGGFYWRLLIHELQPAIDDNKKQNLTGDEFTAEGLFVEFFTKPLLSNDILEVAKHRDMLEKIKNIRRRKKMRRSGK